MKPRFKKVMAAFVILALISTIGYGVYHYAKHPPNVNFTTINFNVNYIGNYSNYLAPTLWAPNLTQISNTSISSVYHVHKNPNEPWQFYFLVNLIEDPGTLNSSLYQEINSMGYDLNDSAVVEAITSTTPGLTVNSVQGGQDTEFHFQLILHCILEEPSKL